MPKLRCEDCGNPIQYSNRRDMSFCCTCNYAVVEHITFTLNWAEFLNMYVTKIGIYLLYAPEGCLYVGKADSLAKRVRTHLKNWPQITGIYLHDLSEELSGLGYEDTKHSLRFYEALTIRQANPILNRCRPKITVRMYQSLPVEIQRKLVKPLET